MFEVTYGEVTSEFVTALPLNDDVMVMLGELRLVGGFNRGIFKARFVSPVPGVDPKTLFALVTVIVSVPVFLSHVFDERSGVRDPSGTLCTDKDKEFATLMVPVNPSTVMTGVQRAKSGTLNVRLNVMVLLSQGYGELWRILQYDDEMYSAGRLINKACPSNKADNAGLFETQSADPSAP